MSESIVLTPETRRPKSCPVGVLAIVPHPDDAEMICGGLLLVSKSESVKTAAVELTRGEAGTRGTIPQRLAELKKAAKVLGLTRREVFDFPDGGLDDTPDTVDTVASVIRFYRPRVVVTTHWQGLHPDHEACWRICKKAAWRANMGKFIDGQPRHKIQALFGGQSRLGITAHLVVDVTKVFARKMQAVHCHKSQLYNPKGKLPKTQIGDKGFLAMFESTHKFYGFQAGCTYGEPYALEKPILAKGLKGLF